MVSRRSHKFPPQGDLPGIGTDFICYSNEGCDSGSSNISDHQSGQKWPNKDDFIKVEIKSDPWEELTPNNIILDHIQPDTLGQCVLRELNVLLVLKGLDLCFQYKGVIRYESYRIPSTLTAQNLEKYLHSPPVKHLPI